MSITWNLLKGGDALRLGRGP